MVRTYVLVEPVSDLRENRNRSDKHDEAAPDDESANTEIYV